MKKQNIFYGISVITALLVMCHPLCRADTDPCVITVSDDQILQGQTSATVLASVYPSDNIARVRVKVIPPGYPSSAIPFMELADPENDGDYKLTFECEQTGIYIISFSASDQQENECTAQARVTQLGGIIVDPTELGVSEPDQIADFTITLYKAPQSDVSLTLSSSDPDECSVSPDAVTFDSENWNTGVTFTVSPEDEDIADGTRTCIISTAPALSTDAYYNGIDPPDITVSVADDDEPLILRAVIPAFGPAGQNMETSLRGSGFTENTQITMRERDENGDVTGNDDQAASVTMVSKTELSLVLPGPEAPSRYTLRASNENGDDELTDPVTFEDPDALEQQKRKKAILIAGSGPYPGNALWPATVKCVNRAYLTLISQGYTHETVYYFTPDLLTDADGDGESDADGDATLENLSAALTECAEGTEELLLYMTGHGGEGTFKINTATCVEILNAEILDGWLDDLQESMTGRLVIVYDSGMSGSFIPLMTPEEETQRIIIASASAHERAWFMEDGVFSFSYEFWKTLLSAGDLYAAFISGKERMSLDQTPVFDADGNGIGSQESDEALMENIVIGMGRSLRSDFPEIGKVCNAQKIGCEVTSARLWASDITFLNPLEKVWAIIVPPADPADYDPEDPVLERPTVDLKDPDEDGVYEGTYDNFVITGTYKIGIYAEDEKGGKASMQTSVIRTCKGDIDGNQAVELADAIMALRIAAGEKNLGIQEDYFRLNIDVNEDGKIGLEDLVYILGKVAG